VTKRARIPTTPDRTVIASALGGAPMVVVTVTLYRGSDGAISFERSADAEKLEAVLADGYRIGEGVGVTGEETYVFGHSGELGMTAVQAVERGVLLLVE
jgi:hypothetical protein